MANRPEYITIGRFGRPRGLAGQLYVAPATDDPARFLDLNEILAVDGDNRRRLEIEKAALVGGRPVLKIVGIDSREDAARLTNLPIEIPMARAQVLPEGRYYQFDLVGCRAVGSDGTDYGIVEEVLFYPASDVYRIQSDRFGEFLFPAVDKFVIEIDIERKKIVIDPPKGLLEELSGD